MLSKVWDLEVSFFVDPLTQQTQTVIGSPVFWATEIFHYEPYSYSIDV
jgi:hypothetical protein